MRCTGRNERRPLCLRRPTAFRLANTALPASRSSPMEATRGAGPPAGTPLPVRALLATAGARASCVGASNGAIQMQQVSCDAAPRHERCRGGGMTCQRLTGAGGM